MSMDYSVYAGPCVVVTGVDWKWLSDQMDEGLDTDLCEGQGENNQKGEPPFYLIPNRMWSHYRELMDSENDTNPVELQPYQMEIELTAFRDAFASTIAKMREALPKEGILGVMWCLVPRWS